MKISPVGVALIKEFEGCSLTAYADPGTGGEPFTIGYGSTEGVYPGMVITADQAEEMLLAEIAGFERAVNEIIPLDLSQPEFDALVSFAYNCGSGALASSTMRRRLLAGEPRCKVYQEEMPRWNKGGNGPMPGLTRRRKAEADLACSGVLAEPVSEPGFLEKAALYYQEEKHQRDAWRALEAELNADTLEAFKNAYRASQEPLREDGNPLDVPYFYQRDSKTGHGERMCFSSSMAMAMDYLDPDAIEGDDDWYLKEVFKFGDSVSSTAQIAAAESLGFNAVFKMDLDADALEAQIDRGIPIPIGILQKGTIDRPSGGGHWITVIGYDETHFVVHDPFGELDLIGGGYPKAGPTDGKGQRYSKKNLLKRWEVEGPGSGWGIIFR